MWVRTFVISILTGASVALSTTANAQIVFRRPSDRVILAQPTPQPAPVVSRTDGAIVRPDGSGKDRIEQTRRADNDFLRSQAAERDRQSQKRRTGDEMVEAKTPRIPDAQRPMKGPPYIFASPKTVIVKPGETFDYAVIMWDAGPDHPYAEIWRSVDGGAEEFLVEKGKGETGAKIELGKTYTFKLSDFGQTLDTVTVTAVSGNSGGGGVGVELKPLPGNDHAKNITDISVEPKSNGVFIRLWAASSAQPIIELGTKKPYVSGEGRWKFPAGFAVGSGGATASQKTGPLSKKVGVKANTLHTFDSQHLPGFPELRYESEHWFIITAQDGSQTTGNFSTAAPTIGLRVVFEKFHLIDDSDELSSGEITLRVFVNFGHPSARSIRFEERQMSSGGTFDINKEIVIPNAPAHLTLAVNAEDDDAGPMAPFRTEGASDAPFVSYGKNDTDQWNVAKDSWNLKNFGTTKNEVYRTAFKLHSADAPSGSVRFEVTGYWEITRKN